MNELESLLREAQARGMDHISIISKTTRQGLKFSASYHDAKGNEAFALADDPAAALRDVLKTKIPRERRPAIVAAKGGDSEIDFG